MFENAVSLATFLLIGFTVLVAGAYVGTLRALDVFYSEADSVFLSEDAGPRQP